MDAPSFDENTANRHKAEAGANYHRYEILRDQGEWGWAVVLLFYSALHLVEAYKCIHHPGRAFKNHEERLDYVFDELFSINMYYRTLYSMSRSVRYDLYQCKEEKLGFAHGDYNLLWLEMEKLGITY